MLFYFVISGVYLLCIVWMSRSSLSKSTCLDLTNWQSYSWRRFIRYVFWVMLCLRFFFPSLKLSIFTVVYAIFLFYSNFFFFFAFGQEWRHAINLISTTIHTHNKCNNDTSVVAHIISMLNIFRPKALILFCISCWWWKNPAMNRTKIFPAKMCVKQYEQESHEWGGNNDWIRIKRCRIVFEVFPFSFSVPPQRKKLGCV